MLGISLYEERVWYKFPFEKLSEKKLVYSGDANFAQLVEASKWVAVIEIYLESNESVVGQMCEEERRVGAAVHNFVDEDTGECMDSPNNSDDEEGEMREAYWIRYIGDGDLKLKLLFVNVLEFRQAVVDYVLKEGWNVEFTRWEIEIAEASCVMRDNGCPWRIYCAYEKPAKMHMVKIYEHDHTCIKDKTSKVVKDYVIANILLNDIGEDKNYRVLKMVSYITFPNVTDYYFVLYV